MRRDGCRDELAVVKRRLLLDSNVWRYFVDARALPELLSATRRSRHTVLMSPAVLYEAAKTRDVVVRDKLLSAMTLSLWKRLMPEAYSEALEIRAEVRRVRPEWLKPEPDLTWFNRVRHDWTRAKGGNWDRIRIHPKFLESLEEGVTSRSREQAYRQREGSLSWSPKWRTASLMKVMAEPAKPLNGWNGTAVEAWRFAALTVFTRSLQTEDHHPYFDWLGGDIELDMMLFQSESLAKFWLHDVETVNMPRHWLRWSFEFLQRQYAVSDGTPVDAQIGTYLVDANLFLSADKTMVRIAEKCRDDAPFPLAASVRVPGGSACVEAVLEQLRAP
jgi:hypothetical protein